jgi:prepilin peptidase CpaA
MQISAFSALWFLPFVVPLCYMTALMDLREMRIPNKVVIALAAVFVLVGLIALPFDEYLWRLAQLGIVLVVGVAINAAGLVGAGDAKFAAAAAPFIAFGDVRLLLAVFAANMLAAFLTHRIAKYTPLRKIAPDWQSWEQGKQFPMGLALGATLTIYLLLGAFFGT